MVLTLNTSEILDHGVNFEYFRNPGYQPKNHEYVKLKFVLMTVKKV